MVTTGYTVTAHEAVNEATAVLASSQYPCVLTGAGVSRESGVHTFRDADGLWSQMDYRKVASVAAFHENPQGVWDFHEGFRALVNAASPNAGHIALVDLEALYFPELPILTQNVDDLHERAGNTNVTHLHGLLKQNRCSRYCQGVPSVVDNSAIDWTTGEKPPRCPHCGALVRPHVTLFGEFLHSAPLRRMEQAVDKADLLIIIGTSGVVAPASEIAERAKSNGAKLIEINPQQSRLTPLVDMWIQMASGEALPEMLRLLTEKV
jgi:NAD-dependent deacetylase